MEEGEEIGKGIFLRQDADGELLQQPHAHSNYIIISLPSEMYGQVLLQKKKAMEDIDQPKETEGKLCFGELEVNIPD